MSDGQLLKPEKDFTKEADKQIPEAQELAKVRYYNPPFVGCAKLIKYRTICKRP